MNILTKLFLGLVFALAAGPMALAEDESSLKGHDTEAPINFVADRLELNDEEHYAVFIGSVVATQGDLKFMTESLRVFYENEPGEENPTAVRLDAIGHIRLESPTESAEGNWGIYDVKSRTITIGGDVILRREGSVITAQRLEIDLITGLTKFDGLPFDSTTGERSRVTGSFDPPDDSK
ncbi:MAG: organic solvent tolerance protein OstA [Alphaproteobacteria bacterium]|nr:MAG: organic solvent tolerance protein OstA [Alphaproteobacteria bacterium]